MQKTTGPLQQHLRLNVRNINTFTEALEIVYSYIKSRHMVVPSRNDGPVDMDIEERRSRIWKRKGKGKGGISRAGKEKEKERAKVSKKERKRNERKRKRTRMFYLW